MMVHPLCQTLKGGLTLTLAQFKLGHFSKQKETNVKSRLKGIKNVLEIKKEGKST